MAREFAAYRDTLAGILSVTEGRHLLTVADVSRYSGIKNYAAIKKRYAFVNNRISAEALARQIVGGSE